MKLGVCAQVLHHLPFEEALDRARALGFEAIELPVDAGNPWIDLDRPDPDAILRAVTDRGLSISALSNHQEGQLLLGPHGEDTAHVHPGAPEERVAWAIGRLQATSALAQALGVGVVCGFVGCPAWHRTFPWPLRDGWERGWEPLRTRLLPVLDAFAARGVVFAHECHPNQQIYDLDTATEGLERLDHHPAMAFNLDPANLGLAGVDPAVFIEAFPDRIVHVHAKDLERVAHRQGRSGLLAHGAWDRPGRGFRFRVPGWGQLDWRALITALHVAGYRGTLAVEHEDPTMARREGLVQAARHLRPLLLHEAPEDRWW